MAAWRPAGPATLYRALRGDATLRFVALTPDAVRPAPPFPAHAAAYDVEHEDGEPEGAGGVVLIAAYALPAEEDERFAAGWERLRELLARRRGYLGARLHRSRGAAHFRAVALVRWSSPLMYARALREPGVGQATTAVPCDGHETAVYLSVGA